MEDLPYAENRATYDPAHPGRLSVEYTYHPELLARRRTFRRAISRAFKGQRRVFLGMLQTTMGIPDGLPPEVSAKWRLELALRCEPALTGAVVEQCTEVLPPRGLKGKLKDLLLLRRRWPRRLV